MARKTYPLCLLTIVMLSVYSLQFYQPQDATRVAKDLARQNGTTQEQIDVTLLTQSEAIKNITLEDFFSVVKVSSENIFQIWPLEPILMYRALCSVESWALNHPNAAVYYTFTVNTLHDPNGITTKLMRQYSNMKFIYVDLAKVFIDTPLNNLASNSVWEKSQWPGTHLADFLRQAILWHKGGYYSDTDIYPVKTLNLLRNFVTTNVIRNVDPALMHYDAHHPWVKAYMETIANDYKPDKYNHHGPIAGTETRKRLCDVPGGFQDVQINGSYSYAQRDCIVDGRTIHFLTQDHFKTCCSGCLKKGGGQNFEKFIEDFYGFHTCGSDSRHRPESFTSESLMQVSAKKNCPLIYKEAQRNSNFW